MSLFQTLRFIADHPLNRQHKSAALLRFLKWQIGIRLLPGRVVYDWINGTSFVVQRGETGLTGNLYCGLHEFSDMAFVLHVVGVNDLFVDVGANVGSYTLLACSVKGARGYCFEPVPATYRRLLDNLRLNDLTERVVALNCGLAETEGELRFSSGENCMNHVLADGEAREDVVAVRVLPLDQVLAEHSPTVMKIDVEGFESVVIRGARKTLARSSLLAVIMELNGSGDRYGFDEDTILDEMKDCGFSTHVYEPFGRKLLPLDGKKSSTGNTLFIRDVEAIRARIAASPRIRVSDRAL